MRSRRLIIFVSVIVLPAALYLLGYFVFLRGRIFEPNGVDPATNRNLFLIYPDYSAEGADWFFHPMHLLDKRIRPEYWTVVLPTD